MKTIPMPVAGGRWHGEVFDVERDASAYVIVKPLSVSGRLEPVDLDPTRDHVLHTVRRVTGIMPGRTDRQCIRILTAPGYDAEPPQAARAIMAAWAAGWSPPDDTSEFWPAGPAGAA